MLIEDATAPREQRHIARRILARLVVEHGAEKLPYLTVSEDGGSAGRTSTWTPAAGLRC